VRSRFSTIAYMDDTVWVANTKDQLQNILQTAELFYEFAGIKVNPKKSVLVAPKDLKEQQYVTYNNEQIMAIGPKEIFRVLGCWFTPSKSHKKIHKQIIKEAYGALNCMRYAKITEKQCIYIVNSVVLSRVAYRIQNTKLPNGQCEELTNRYTYLAKNKAQISKSVPNSAFWHNRIYGLKKVVDIQLQQHASIIIRLLNHPDFSKSAFKIILQQLQNKADNGISILRYNPGVYAKDYDKCRLAEILRSCHECGITFSGNVQTEWPRVQSLQGDSINEIITGMS